MKFILIVLILIASLGALSTCEGLDFHYKKTTKDSDKPTKPTSDSSPSSTTVPENPSPTAAPESPSSPATPPPPPPTPDPNNPNNPSPQPTPQPTPDPNNPNNPTPQPTPDPNNPNNPSPQPTPDPNNPNNPPPTNPNPNNPNPTTSLPGSEPTTAPAPAPPNTPPNKSDFPTVLASAKVASDVAPPVPLKNGKMTGLLIFYQPSDGKTSITGYLNNLLDDVEGKYTFKIVNAKGTVINDLTGMINPIFQLGGSSTFSTIQDSVRLSGDPATNALGSFFVITQRDVAICKALIGEEFVIGG